MTMLIFNMAFERVAVLQRVQTCGLCVQAFLSGMFVVFMSLLVTGCGTAGLCIVDVENASVVFRRERGTFRESPLYATREGIMTLQRTETNDFVLRRVGFAGKELNRTNLSLFTTSYGDSSYAFSEDGQKKAYVNWQMDQNHRLVVCSTVKDNENILPAGMGDNLGRIYGGLVLWVNNDLVLFSPLGGGQGGIGGIEPVYLIDVCGKKMTQLCNIVHPYGPRLLSPSKEYFLVSEEIKDSRLYRIQIIDLKTKQNHC